jgi:hypothetical protein
VLTNSRHGIETADIDHPYKLILFILGDVKEPTCKGFLEYIFKLKSIKLTILLYIFPVRVSGIDNGPLDGIGKYIYDFFLVMLGGEVVKGIEDDPKLGIALKDL